jgi:hypothetical protein
VPDLPNPDPFRRCVDPGKDASLAFDTATVPDASLAFDTATVPGASLAFDTATVPGASLASAGDDAAPFAASLSLARTAWGSALSDAFGSIMSAKARLVASPSSLQSPMFAERARAPTVLPDASRSKRRTA